MLVVQKKQKTRNVSLYEMLMPATPLIHMPFKISLSPKANAVPVLRSFCFLAKENS